MYGAYYYGFDWTYFLVIIGAVLSLAASAGVKSTYSRYSKVRSASGITGAEAAQRILQMNGIYDVQIRHVSGNLTDHFDPRSQTVNLSDSVYNSTSIAAIGVAAHECGHVLQDHEQYAPLRIRTALVPIASFGSNAGIWIVIIGLMFSLSSLFIDIGIVLFSFGVLFQLVTLPVEFNASGRALTMLEQYGILSSSEDAQTRKVLKAAAMTYVAAAAASVLQLVRLLLLSNSRRRRD